MSCPLPRSGGTYVLVFEATHQISATVGALGQLLVEPGFYLYVGSAHGGGGLQARVGRHLALDKTLRWHMDYLRPHLLAHAVWWQADARRLEDSWVELMSSLCMTPIFKGFGASDSRHTSHLFYSHNTPSFTRWHTHNPSAQCWLVPRQ